MESIDLMVLRTARDWLAAGEQVLLATVAAPGARRHARSAR